MKNMVGILGIIFAGMLSAHNNTQEIRIAVMTGHFFSQLEREVPHCTADNSVIRCIFKKGIDRQNKQEAAAFAANAHVHWYHAPSVGRIYPKKNGQLRAIMSMESADYYPVINNPEMMKKFDIEMTYRLNSTVPLPYLRGDQIHAWQTNAPVAFEKKEDAIAYIQSNCNSRSRRDQIVQQIMMLHNITVHSYGRCLNNMHQPPDFDRIDTMADHRFCIAFENSVAHDYVTEKLWDAFAAGCVPIYYGAPNIAELLPAPDSIIDYRALGSPEALAKELLTLSADKEAYEKRLAWRNLPVEQLAPGFRRLVEIIRQQHSQCKLCALAATILKDRATEKGEQP